MNETFILTVLHTKASAELEEEIKNELESPDPSSERAEAVFKEAKNTAENRPSG
jgi:hypothetical protein